MIVTIIKSLKIFVTCNVKNKTISKKCLKLNYLKGKTFKMISMMVKTSSVVGFYLKHASELFIFWLHLTSCITNKTENLSITVTVYC